MNTNLLVPQKFIEQGNLLHLPMLGLIKAGYPIADEQYGAGGVSLEHFLLQNSDNTYLLKVQGDSLVHEGIKRGDLVILDAKRTPKEDDIVAACIDDKWTVNYLKSLGLTDNNNIGGVVVSVIRKYY